MSDAAMQDPRAVFESFPPALKAGLMDIAEEYKESLRKDMRPSLLSRVRHKTTEVRVSTVSTAKIVGRRTKKTFWNATNALFRFIDKMIARFNAYLHRHPVLTSFLAWMLAFTVGFVGFILLWTAIMLSLVLVIALFGA